MAKKLIKSTIKKFKEKLQTDKEKIARQIEDLQRDDPFADPTHASDNAAVDTDVREQVGHDTIQAQIKDLTRRLKDIEMAFGKIEKGRYGICEKCGMSIPLHASKLTPS